MTYTELVKLSTSNPIANQLRFIYRLQIKTFMNEECKKMTSLCLNDFPEELMLTILDFLNYEDLFYKKKSTISKSFHNATKKLLKNAKIDNEISNNFLSSYWEKSELKNIPIILYCPNKIGASLKTRLFRIFETKQPYHKLFVSNVFTNKLSFMIKPLDNQILFIEFLENKLNYNVYTRRKAKQILY